MKMMSEDGKMDAGGRGAVGQVNVAEGRVPVSWNEAVSWRASRRLLLTEFEGVWVPSTVGAGGLLGFHPDTLRFYRLVDLVASPEGMDGGGWLGEGRHVPEGWEWRPSVQWEWQTGERDCWQPTVVQCRPPVRVRDAVEVPLTRLVGRTIEGQTKKVAPTELRFALTAPHGIQWLTPAGQWIDVEVTADDRVRVYAEGDEK